MRRLTLFIATLLAVMVATSAFVTLRDGYFYDEDQDTPFIPRGISYQTFVQDIGQWITYAQIDYDLREMKKSNINSIRVDFAWRDIENDAEGVYDWDRFDFLVNICEQYDMKIFPLIGYQWPPSWFPGNTGKAIVSSTDEAGWYSMHPPSPAAGQTVTPETFIFDTYWVSDVMSFTHPKSIEKYANFMAAVAGRYKNSKAIAGWVTGNEFGFFGLWSFRYDGYEPTSQQAFRDYLSKLYNSDINQLNGVWGTQLSGFDQVIVPPKYNRDDPAWGDAIQWRKGAVAEFIAHGAKAVRIADPNHLMSYSMVGMIFGGVDSMYHCEDPMTIVKHCRDLGYPLNFWSINTYPSSYPGNELRTGTFGIEFHKRTGLPILYTETGSSSTDAGYIGFDDPETRQGKLLRNDVWEAYLNGIIGVHIFTWPDRDYITDREYGFGILKRYREPKKSFQYMQEVFYQVALIEQHTPKLFTSLKYAEYDVAFYWPSNTTDQMFNRYQNNMAGVWGPLTRLGLRCRFMNETQLYEGDYKNVKVLILPRNQRMIAGDLRFIYDNVVGSGVHVYTDADLPGYQDYYARQQPDFTQLMEDMFGIQPIVVNAYQDTITPYDIKMSTYRTLELQPQINMLPMRAFQSSWFGVWKYHKVQTTSGQTIVNMLIQDEKNVLFPGIVMKPHAKAKTIASMFALGDTNCEALQCWTGHYIYFKGLFLTEQGLGLKSSIDVAGSAMVQAFLIESYNDLKLLYVHNWDDYSYTQGITLTVPSIVGMTVKDMLNSRRLITPASDGVLTLDMGPNDLRIFLINEPIKPFVSFVYNQTDVDIHPALVGPKVTVRFDTATSSDKCVLRVKLLAEGSKKLYTKVATQVKGVGYTTTNLPVVDYSPLDKGYLSSSQGMKYYLEASVSCPGYDTQSSTVNVLVSWPVAPKSLPATVTTGVPTTTIISWENFPIARLNAFQGMTAIWNSTKTAARDPTHYDKVKRVAAVLESIGYTYSRMVAWDEGLQDYGPLYHVFNDSVPDDQTGKGNLNPKYFGDMIKYIILPGVSVLSNAEAKNLRTWLTSYNFTDVTLISTEGGLGRWDENGNEVPGRLADLFGTSGAYVQGVRGAKLEITDDNHPSTQSVGKGTYDVSVGSFADTATAKGGVGHGTITQGDGKTYPAIITNQLSDIGKAMMFNFDATDSSSMNLQSLWSAVSTWMHCNSLIYKLRWDAVCDNRTIGSSDGWILQGTGSMSMSVTPTDVCTGTEKLIWRGYVYYWNNTNPYDVAGNKGYYTSENDNQLIPDSSAGRTGFTWFLAIVCIVAMLL